MRFMSDETNTHGFTDDLSAHLRAEGLDGFAGPSAVPLTASVASRSAGAHSSTAPYRIDRVLKSGPAETTQVVYYRGADGRELGPFIRKLIALDAGRGQAYERLYQAQRDGTRFTHLPRIMSVGARGADLEVVMELVVGETLDELVHRVGGSPELACRVFPALCDAVAELHGGFEPPIIHRDLKPSNIIVARYDAGGDGGPDRRLDARPPMVTLIDFGIARTWRAGAGRDTFQMGTAGYAPPEQFGFGQTDVRSDVYALGRILLFCLLGEEPGPSAIADVARVAPAEMVEVARVATSLDPARRFVSARVLRRAFLGAAGDVGATDVARPVLTHAARPLTADAGRTVGKDASGAGGATAGDRVADASAPRPRQGARPAEPSAARTSHFSEPPSHASLRSAPDRFLALVHRKVPTWAGRVWNACIIAWAVFIACVIVDVALRQSDYYPFPVNFAGVMLFFMPGFLLPCYLMLDKRRIRKRLPWFRLPGRYESVTAFALLLASAMVATAILAVSSFTMPR